MTTNDETMGRETAAAEIATWTIEIARSYLASVRPYAVGARSYDFDRGYCAAIAERFELVSPYEVA